MLNIMSLKSGFLNFDLGWGGEAAIWHPAPWVCHCCIYIKMIVAVETYHSGKGKCDVHFRTGLEGSEGE